MKRFLPFVALLPLIGPVGLAASGNEDLDFQLELGWKLANSAKGSNHSSIAEYVREGDDINNWKELVTLQTWGKSSHQLPPDEMLKSLQTARDKECPDSTQWNVIGKDANSILYEWRAKPCLGWPDQCEIARIIIGNHLVFALHYAAKGSQLPLETRSKWIKTFSEVTILGKLAQEKQKKLDPCTLLTATDAASIVGAPMKIVDLSKKNCTYGEYRGRGSFVTGGILDRALFLEVNRYKDPQAEEKAWTKDTKSALDPANKDQTQVLNGIGDEAYLVGRTNDGKLTENPAIFVRKGAVIFSIAILLPPGHQPVTLSADALIAAAKKIANQL